VRDHAERFLEDVLQEPESLARVLRDADVDLDVAGVRRVRFVGMGSSRYAALPAASMLRAAGLDAHVERASAAEPTPPAADLLTVVVSAAGKTPETVEAAARHAGTSRVVAVTNDRGSPLAATADRVVGLNAGEERGGVACLTYQASVAVLLLLAGRVAGRELRLGGAVAAGTELRDRRDRWLPRAIETLGGRIAAIAPEERMCSAEQAALVLREGPRIQADACETGDWPHVDVYLTRRPGYRALLFAGSRFDGAVVEWLERRGCAFVAVGRGVRGSVVDVEHAAAGTLDELLVETMVADLVAAELWRRAWADG
jgi:fructoselysine-6-P-deglycase FrlB-like protein